MNLNTLAIESQDLFTSRQGADSAADNAPEITPVEMENYKLVGGGSSIVLLG
jgi:hypothetical protein